MAAAPTGPSGPVPPPSGAPRGGREQAVWLAVAAVAVVLAGLVAVVTATSGDDGGDRVGARAGAAVRLEPVAMEQPNPFVDEDLDPVVEAGETVSLPPADLPSLDDDTASDALAGKRAAGTATGLYGGSLDTAVCDVEQLVAFHADPANAAVTAAFARVQGISAAQVADHLRGLAPVRLRFDTRVTNHGLVDGAPAPFQSVLQAGTAVLVDATGVPRVKCFCGNPLAEPQPIGGTGQDPGEVIDNPDDGWEGFDPDGVVTVEPGSPADGLVVVDLETGAPIEVPVDPATGDRTRQVPTTGGNGRTATTPTNRPPDPPGDGDRGGGSSGTVCTSTPEHTICRAN